MVTDEERVERTVDFFFFFVNNVVRSFLSCDDLGRLLEV